MASLVKQQPASYFILSDQEAKDDLAKLLDSFKDNKPNILSASYVIGYATMEHNFILTLDKIIFTTLNINIMLKASIDQY